MPESNVVRSLITPHDLTLRSVFNAQKSYFIDIYQREYKWTDKQVNTLLKDVEVRFLQNDFNHRVAGGEQDDQYLTVRQEPTDNS
jgi:uncharacterized protein with ParB-like and HNH nuclease domain